MFSSMHANAASDVIDVWVGEIEMLMVLYIK